MKKRIRQQLKKGIVLLTVFAMLISALLPAFPAKTAMAADVSYGIPSELTGIWQYVGQSLATDGATTWMRGNAYRTSKDYFNGAIDTYSTEYKNRYEKLQQDEYLKNTRIFILYLPLCPYSKSYLPVFQDMAYECNAQVAAVDMTQYLTASLMPYYSVSTYGATSPIVLYMDKDGVPQGQSGVHSAVQFAEILKDAGYQTDYTDDGSEHYSVEQEYKKTILNETNRQRIREGLLPLSTYSGLSEVADLRAKEVNVFTSHTRPDGTLFTTALTGLSAPSVWGENICAGPIVSTPTAAMTGWMNSPGHRANILSESYSHIGVGYYCNTTDTSRYKDNWVQLFSGTCKAESISVDIKQIEVLPDVPISDMDITVTVNCPVHGATTMPLIDEMCTGYDRTVTGEQNVTVHYGDLTTEFLVSSGDFEPMTLTEDMVAVIEDTVVYTGQMLTPAIMVSNATGEYTLLENYSYTVEYADNVNAGTGTVTVTGKGNYTGSVTKTFTILPKDIGTAVIKGVKETYTYTSRPVTPAFHVFSDNVMLYEGQDYETAYTDNIGKVVEGTRGNPDTVDGTAVITVTGKGNYTGTATTTFQIVGDDVFKKATQLAKKVWPNKNYGANAYEFWQIMYKETYFSIARNEVDASLKAAKESGYFEKVMSCAVYPEAARRINDFYRFCYEIDHAGVLVERENKVTASEIDEASVALDGVESSLGDSDSKVVLQIADTKVPASVSAAEYDVISAVALDISLEIDGADAVLVSPVTITMNIPESIGDGADLVVLHYKDGVDAAPEVLDIVLNGDGTFSFTTGSFSSFVLVNKVEQYDAAVKDSADGAFGQTGDAGAAAPADVKAVRSGANDITVSWKGVADTENWTVTGYEVSYSVHENMSGAKTVTVGAEETSHVLKGLANGTYYVTVSTIAKSAWTSYAATYSHVTKVALTQLSSTEYEVTVPASVSGGEVVVSSQKSIAGAVVTVTVLPSSGYELSELLVKDSAGQVIEFVTDGDNQYTFVMPADSVGVEVSFKEIPKAGWEQVDKKWYYYGEDGKPVVGWQKIDRKWYLFDDEGTMMTGWQKIDNTWYYMKLNGEMATGWQKIGNTWYYMKLNGAMATGWQKIGGKWYYLTPSGAMATGWKAIDGKWYYLEPNGTMATGWKMINDTWYYLKPDGSMATGWLYWKENWYYLYSNGSMVVGIVDIGGTIHNFDDYGVWLGD